MPSNAIGYSFAPTFENAERRGVGPRPQGAIQTLNYRLPQVTGAPSRLSPLVSDTPSMGFGNAVIQSVLRTILGPDAAASMPNSGHAGMPGQGSMGGVPGAVGGGGDDQIAALLQMLAGGDRRLRSPMDVLSGGDQDQTSVKGPNFAPMTTPTPS